ncbi:MAG: ribosomal protein S18-alanine N-acetyltransferase [Candidatus Thermoplasmatota archaeon]|nr:ribosomal protein S18-alanine N-acetyltransferase [Candidatus Thermoplasmatota archaeon]
MDSESKHIGREYCIEGVISCYQIILRMMVHRLSRRQIPSVMELARSTLTEIYSPSTFIAIQEQCPEGCLVAAEGENVIGFIMGMETKPGKGKILMLAVRPEFRRQGIGSMLLKSLLRQFTVRGIFSITLETRANNTAAMAFYRAHGFEVKKIVPKFYTDDTDAYEMCKSV